MTENNSKKLTGGSAVQLVLASASSARVALLRGAGLAFSAKPAAVDEDAVKEEMSERGAPAEDAAMALAILKAERISQREPDALVIGADQLLDCDGQWFDKAVDREDGLAQLNALRGRTHGLATAVCVAQGGQTIWRFVETPTLRMRDLSDKFIEDYLISAGEEATGCVGAYRLEGLGAQLFAQIKGDYFTILGLPLLPLLGFLRQHDVVPE